MGLTAWLVERGRAQSTAAAPVRLGRQLGRAARRRPAVAAAVAAAPEARPRPQLVVGRGRRGGGRGRTGAGRRAVPGRRRAGPPPEGARGDGPPPAQGAEPVQEPGDHAAAGGPWKRTPRGGVIPRLLNRFGSLSGRRTISSSAF